MPGYDWISLTTDYGLSDGFVAACHGVLGRISPAARVIELVSSLPPRTPPGDATSVALSWQESIQ